VLVARASTAAGRGLPAPADEILTTTPGAGYAFFSGTSLAAAHLTGVVALLLERAPKLDVASIAEVLGRTLVNVDDAATVNACHALEAVADVRVCGARVEMAVR
jgi:subtilisin family serine protease